MAQESRDVIVGMSGGVDSSTAAWYLKRDGYRVVGVTLLFHACAREERKLERARAMCAQLGIEHETVDLRERYHEEIERWYADGWRAGRQPEPVSRATSRLLFPQLLACAEARGIEQVATGHYARVTRDEFGIGLLPCQLQRAQEKAKGQSYTLAGLGQPELFHVLFPNAPFPKSWIRRDAMRAGLMPFVEVEDDQDVPAFLEDGGRVAWLEGPGGLAAAPGDIVNVLDDQVVAQHCGLHRYEIGQRLGSGGDGARGLFVIAKDIERNVLLAGPKNLSRVEMCMLGDVHWTSIETPEKKRTCRAQYKPQAKPVPCKIAPLPQGLAVTFTETAHGVCPGQELVLYSDDLVLGCGTVVA